jgi:hypothetical protein
MSQAVVLSHMTKTGSISIREAMDDYGLSGGSLTKVISRLRRSGYEIVKEWRKHPISGRKYARYYFPSVFVPEAKAEVTEGKPQVAEATKVKVGDRVLITGNVSKYTGSQFHYLKVGAVVTVLDVFKDGSVFAEGMSDDGLKPTHQQYLRKEMFKLAA